MGHTLLTAGSASSISRPSRRTTLGARGVVCYYSLYLTRSLTPSRNSRGSDRIYVAHRNQQPAGNPRAGLTQYLYSVGALARQFPNTERRAPPAQHEPIHFHDPRVRNALRPSAPRLSPDPRPGFAQQQHALHLFRRHPHPGSLVAADHALPSL